MTIRIDSTTIGTQPDGTVLAYYVGRCTDCPYESAMRFDRAELLRWGAEHELRAHPGRDLAARRLRRR